MSLKQILIGLGIALALLIVIVLVIGHWSPGEQHDELAVDDKGAINVKLVESDAGSAGQASQ
jgi:hypothetical protein